MTIEIDSKKLSKLMELTGIRTKTEAIDYALRKRKGGGVILNPQNRAFLKESGVCILVTIPRKDLLLRLAKKPLI